MLRSPGGLTVRIDTDGSIRLGIEGGDWLGRGDPGVPVIAPPAGSTTVVDALGPAEEVVVADGGIRRTVRAYADRPLAVFELSATGDMDGLATGTFDQPSAPWPTFTPARRDADGAPDDLTAVVFQHCEFGLPATVGAELDNFFLLPHRPPTGWPLCLQADAGALVIAPLDHFHEQIIGLNGGTLRCGWHGDLDEVPAGFTTRLGVFAAATIRDAIGAWGHLLTGTAGAVRPGRWADALATRPSYWTDNGAAYWYRTEPGYDVPGSIVAAVDDLIERGVPLGAVQLDSWFYPHMEIRPFDTDDWVVPPSPLSAWEARGDILPDGIDALATRLGDRPLVAHIRHLSADASMTAEVPVWVDGPVAVPSTPEGYERWLDQCVAWGVETFEHDWMVEVFHAVRQLRSTPGRARAWQEGIDAAARERGITLQWCMATPADFAQTTTLTQVTSVRTCGDHGYIATPGQLWAWFATTNTIARSLGLMPYKDVFRTDATVAGTTGAPEALLSALSTGPVGLGDRVGRCDTDLVTATCRADGVLVKPDVPVAATTDSIVANTAFQPHLLTTECHSDHPAGRWSYIATFHATPTDEVISGTIELARLDDATPSGPVVCWDWRNRTATPMEPTGSWSVHLEREGWDHRVLAPVLSGGIAVIGDVSRFVPAGDARIVVTPADAGYRLTVKGAGETVRVTGWADAAPTSPTHTVDFDPPTGVWTLDVPVGPRGWESVIVRAAGT